MPPILRIHLAGQFDAHAVSARWVPSTESHPPDVEALIDAAWARALAVPGIKLFDGPMCRLESWHATGPTLTLHLSKTSYKRFLGTNLSHPHLADRLGPAALANPVGVSPALVSSDGHLLMGRRNATVAYYPHRIHPFSGALEPRNPLDLFAELSRELHEELHFAPEHIASMHLTGIAEDLSIRQPELICLVHSTLDRDAILERVQPDEHHAAWHCPANPDRLAQALAAPDPTDPTFTPTETLTPIAIAALLLFGRLTFGDTWYDEHRPRFCTPTP
jgi:hypothetical protein